MKVFTMESKWGRVGPTSQKKCENEIVRLDCPGTYGLYVSPSLGALTVTNKLEKKNSLIQNLFLSKKMNNGDKRAPRGFQKGDPETGETPFGAPLEPQADFWFTKWAHSAPKVVPGAEKKT